jgi:uncharacterized protein YrzB (UPF0473 family)
MNDKEMIIIDDSGDERLTTIIFTQEIDEKTYVVFEFNDSKEMSAAQYIPDENNPEEGEFIAIEDDSIWEQLEEALSEYDGE